MKPSALPFLLCLLAVAPALRAEPWRAWETAPDAPLAATFEASADTRRRDFVRNDDGDGYASVYARAQCPGELVLTRREPGSGKAHAENAENAENAESRPPRVRTVRVETAFVPGPKTQPPVLPAGAHYEANPFLPFPVPAGSVDPWVFSVTATFPDGAAWPLRVPVRLPTGHWWSRELGSERFRVRWEARDAAGAVVARGVLPDAFETGGHGAETHVVDARGDRMPAKSGAARATPGTWNAWPFLASSAVDVVFDEQSLRDAFGADDAAAVRFLRRAALVGVGTTGATRLWPAAPDLARARPLAAAEIVGRSRGNDHVWSFSQTTPGSRKHWDKDSWVKRNEAERLLEPARIPDATLGRRTTPFFGATVLFMVTFAIGTALLLVRFFALRRGEARLAVWRALPLWCAAAAAFALFALPLFLDRGPRADVTEWRYGWPDAPEELRLAEGRFHSFDAAPSSWTVPLDAWFYAIPGANREKVPGTGPAETIDFAAGVRELRLPERTRGKRETVHAATFAPHGGPAVEISPDPDARAADFLWAVEAPAPENAEAATQPAPAEARDSFRQLLRDWTCGDPDRRSRVPARTVTARGDYAAVWVFARGHWYALGPMKAGETRALDRSQRVQDGMDAENKPYDNLLAHAPFALDTGRIVPVAESWLARDAKARNGSRETTAEEEPAEEIAEIQQVVVNGQTIELPHMIAKSVQKKDAPHPVTRDFLDRLDDAFAVALEAPPEGASGRTAAQALFLAPALGARGEISSRIVHVEVLP